MNPTMADIRIVELLPFWVNGTLAADEAATVAAAVAGDQALAAEADFLRALHDRIQAEDAGYSPGAIGLARLKRDIAAQQPRREVPLRAAAAAAVVAAILGFAANQSFSPVAPEYIQASGGEDMPAVVVAFTADAALKGLSEFLMAEGVVIMDGPSALGLFRLAPVDPGAVDLAVLAKRLQTRADLFEVVDLPE